MSVYTSLYIHMQEYIYKLWVLAVANRWCNVSSVCGLGVELACRMNI